MNRLSTYIFSLVLIVSSLSLHAQDADTVEVKKVRISLGFALDYGKILTLPSKFETKAEVAFDITIMSKFQILVEIGYASLTPQDAINNGTYNSAGLYYRAGLTYGGEILPKNFLSFGVLYGLSNFEDSGTVLIKSTIWEDFNSTFERNDLTASWYEILIISEQRIRNNLALGVKFRWRNLTNFTNNYEPEVLAIPGYGRTFNNSIPAVNLYVKFLLPL